MALTVTLLAGRGYAMDTLLGVLAHSALAFGLVAVSFLSGVRIDLMAYLFGDILAVSRADLLVIWGGAAMVVALIAWRWDALLTATLNEELAYASGLDPRREQLILTLALAITVAVAIKVVGVLLIAAMLIIPAAAARNLARTPETMAVFAAVIGAVSVVAGLRGAFWFGLAGVVGFEPTVHGTKNRCLTAWLHPNRAALATQSPSGVQAPPALFYMQNDAIPAGPRGAGDRPPAGLRAPPR
jgi:ABC-type Mn2+/Zn2+ transport system permease subunit